MYDVSDTTTFNNIRNWMEEIKINSNRKVRIILVGNKCDSPSRKVSEEEGKKIADEFNIIFFEVSNKAGININEVFDYLVKDLLNKTKKSFKLSFRDEYFDLNLYNKFLKY